MTKKPKKLTAHEANRLAMQLQTIKIRLMDLALQYSFNGESKLWGQVIDEFSLKKEKRQLDELYRLEILYASDKTKLPYIPGGHGGVKKIKEHYQPGTGNILFIEAKESTHKQSVENFMNSKSVSKRRINKTQQFLKRKLKDMTTKKRKVTSEVSSDEDLLGFIDTKSIDDALASVKDEIPAYKTGDKLEFVHAGGKVKGSVLKVLSEGKLKMVDRAGTVYNITETDIILDGQTAAQHIANQKKRVKAVIPSEDLEAEPVKPAKKAEPVKPAKKAEPVKPAKKAEPVKPAKKAEPVKPAKKAEPSKKVAGQKTQKQLVEDFAEKGERDYDKIAAKTGVERKNVSQYMYRWKIANPKKW